MIARPQGPTGRLARRLARRGSERAGPRSFGFGHWGGCTFQFPIFRLDAYRCWRNCRRRTFISIADLWIRHRASGCVTVRDMARYVVAPGSVRRAVVVTYLARQFGLGGYLAGTLRPTINAATPPEVEFRDGVHGLLVWEAPDRRGVDIRHAANDLAET
jgi:hypothetical protein